MSSQLSEIYFRKNRLFRTELGWQTPNCGNHPCCPKPHESLIEALWCIYRFGGYFTILDMAGENGFGGNHLNLRVVFDENPQATLAYIREAWMHILVSYHPKGGRWFGPKPESEMREQVDALRKLMEMIDPVSQFPLYFSLNEAVEQYLLLLRADEVRWTKKTSSAA